ncbi:properdin-like [Neosynchiropus ocellatus]
MCGRMATEMRLVLVLFQVLVCVKPSVSVLCFSSVNRTAGQCDARLGEVDRDDCCLNINNGFQVSALEECQSCGHPVWTSWTPWSSCSVQCGEGVRQRTRKCFGVGQCDGPNLKQQMEPCTGTCCDAKGWGSWNPWSPCSVSCGEQGVRRRARACAAPPHCHSLCSGASEEKEPCLQMNACPVHGSWSKWASWSPCVGTCITDSMIPVRRRDRSCSDPAPSPHTVPPGDDCQGETGQVQLCTEVNNCPVDGNWGAWSPPGPCSTTCGEGLQLSNRQCDSPAPKYGGKVCEGPSTETSVCKSKCPVDGFWSGWSNWGECSTSCVPQGGAVVRKRHRFCSNPAPSTDPPGRSCHGDHADAQPCLNVPPCPVDGGWGSWSSFTPCPVTCGLGIQLSSRKCVKPSPKHGGRPCAGDAHRSRTCNTKVPCPVDGQWAAWSSWGQCTYAHDETQKIACTTTGGLQSRTRECLHRSHGGLACEGEEMVQSQVCYDVSGCKLKGQWEGWGSWTWCGPDCGPKSTRQRQRICSPDYSEYSPTIGFQNLKATFSGIPTVNCGDPPNGQKIESQPCLNAPPCP